MGTHFSEKLTDFIKKELGRYETRRSAILPVLHAIQDEHHWIRDEDVLALESEFGLSAVDVREVMLFYTMYRSSPCQPYRFEVCNSVSCWLSGSEQTLEALRNRAKEWRESKGEEPPFEVHEVGCLGICGEAPVMYINKERFLRVSPATALRLVDEYTARTSREGR